MLKKMWIYLSSKPVTKTSQNDLSLSLSASLCLSLPLFASLCLSLSISASQKSQKSAIIPISYLSTHRLRILTISHHVDHPSCQSQKSYLLAIIPIRYRSVSLCLTMTIIPPTQPSYLSAISHHDPPPPQPVKIITIDHDALGHQPSSPPPLPISHHSYLASCSSSIRNLICQNCSFILTLFLPHKQALDAQKSRSKNA